MNPAFEPTVAGDRIVRMSPPRRRFGATSWIDITVGAAAAWLVAGVIGRSRW
jgi:hypothetical protein